MLTYMRRIIALLFGAIILFFFLDFARVWPESFFNPAKTQFIPVLLGGSFLILFVLLLITGLFGRIYCSVLCPLGIFQDAVNRLLIGYKKKNRRRFSYLRPLRVLQWSIVGILVLAFIFGFPLLLLLLDPYSAFGRMAVNVSKPVYMVMNNVLASIGSMAGQYSLYQVDPSPSSWGAFAVGVFTILLLAVLVWKWGRIWCNSICPVGTVLGLLSRYSLFRIRIDKDRCTHCGACSRFCKSGCIDSKNQHIDADRCVTCFDCLEVCTSKALVYSLRTQSSAEKVLSGKKENTQVEDPTPSSSITPKDPTRRQFLTTTLTVGTAALLAQDIPESSSAVGYKSYKRQTPLTPPGAISRDRFTDYCTGCHLCISKCPSHVLVPALTEYGLSGFLQPTMSFEKGFCNFDCTLCTDVCPTGALRPLTVEEKHITQPGHVVFLIENCIVSQLHQSCGACSEHCPTQAISMVPYEEGEGLTIPKVDTTLCVGCGGCEYVCPTIPYKAVYIEGHDVHTQAQKVEQGTTQEADLDGFGF